MGCVNISTKEFKYLAERNNLSINTLELLTHKYWLENKTEDYFPSDVYIQAQLGKIPYEEPSKAVRDLWELKYKNPQEYTSSEALEEARREALKYFPEEAVTYHKNFKDNFVMVIRKPIAKLSLNISDLTGKNNHSDQEQADFDIILRSLSKELGKSIPIKTSDQSSLNELQMSIASPQTFTFKDGTTVKAPFKPNYQQVDALNAMDEFVKSDKTSMTLSGFAGTGKTSIMEMLAQKMRKNYKPVMFCASTNKAAAVLKEKVSEAGFDAQTLNKVFGITVEVDSSRSYNAKNLVNKLKDPNIAPGTTVIIDEASMINEVNYNILNKIAKEKGLKIIYVGDEAQLPPVNETKISKVFRDNKNEIKKLTIVERTDDNAILKEATNLRNGEQLSQESSFNNKGEGVAYIKQNNTNDIDAVINHFIPQLQSDPNSFRILAYTNAAVSNYNVKVRSLLGYNDPVPRVGEPIMGYSNWGYTWTKRNGGTYKFINSEAYVVKTVGEPITKSKSLPDGTSVSMQAVPITLENSLGELVRVDFMDIKNNEENRKAAFLLAKAKRDLHNKANKMGVYEAIALREEANKIEKFLFVNDNIGEKIGNEYITYQSKVFDFGYAMTTHKSQGSTFTHVLVDDVDISKARFDKNQAYASVFLEGIDNVVTDTSIQTGVSGDIDLGIDEYDVTSTSEQEQTPQINSEDTNLRQQLEYVAVSRATDTVTIISNNVKKEDSPLNHINEAPANSSVESSITASPKSVEQMSSQEVWRYVSAIQPLTKRSQVEYTPQGQKKQTYTVENGHIYNKEGEEIYPEGTVHKTHRNKILANLAVKEGRAVVVTHPTSGENYVVDNNQQITSVKTGNIMQWDANNGDRRRILTQAEIAFRERIRATKESGSAITQQLMDYLPLIGIDTHNREEMIQYLKENGNKAIQEAIVEQQEMQEIKAKAQADGTFMKAPNGKPTNLTERQWLQVRTRNFINWFGDWINDPANASKVVDENGEPLVVYHGSKNGNFNTFDYKHLRKADNGFFFTSDKEYAKQFGDIRGFFLNIKNPNVTDTPLNIDSVETLLTTDYKRGTDGIQGHDDTNTNENLHKSRGQEYVAIRSNQIKSATDNNGMFSTENDDIQAFQTSEGEIYGFVDKKGDMYLDETVISSEHPIHEYTHLWDRIVAKNNPKLWKQGITLMKKISLWQDIENDPNYGQKWKAMKGMTPQKLESLIASEVHARLVGVNGEQILNNLSKQKGAKGIIGKLKQWLLDFWKDLKATFSDWSEEDLNKLTLQDFTMMTVRDFADGFNPNTFSAGNSSAVAQNSVSGSSTATQQNNVQITESTGSYAQRTRENITWSDVTLSFANDDTTAGEKLTERVANEQGKYISEYLPAPLDMNDIKRRARNQVISMKSDQAYGHRGKILPTNNIKLNIAGNGIYTLLPEGITQEQLNDYVTEYIKELIANGVTISEIRSGGQTGVDEAGIIAAQRLGITASVHAPRGFLFRTAEGKDVANKEAFESRFISSSPQVTTTTATQQAAVPASYEGMITPDANTIFVFGSNPEGRHGAGAAKTAKEKFGAIYGQGEGLQGNAYALPTKDLRSKPLYSEDGGKTPVVMYRGYALKENREAYNIEETIGKTAVDYDDSLKGSLYFTSSKEEAEDYAKSRTDKSPEPPTQENPQGRPINRHYTGDYAKVSKYYISPDAKVEHYKDINDYRKNGTNSNADVIVLDKGTMWADNTEYIVKNPKVLVYDKMKRSISPEQITESIRKMYEVARQNPTKQFKVAYTNGMNEATLNGYTGAEMIKMFKDAGPIPSNVIFNKEWTDHWNEVKTSEDNAQQEVVNNSQNTYSRTISLPGYEYFNDLYEDTSVDAEWKIPLLEDLDRQLSTENTSEQNNNILKQMNKIMDATDQESYYGSLTKAESEKVDKKLSNFEKLSQQVNNLYDSNILSASEITHTAELIMNAVSDEVTRLQKEEGLAKKLFPSLETTLDFQNATRRQIIETIGIPRLLDRAKELFDIGVYDRDDIKLEQEAEVILDNWDAVISFGTKTFSMNEGFGIKMNYENNSYETTNGVHLGTDDYNGQQDIDSLRELEGDDQEHWQIEQKTLDILENATEQVRMAIHECYKMDRNGNPIMSKWGIKERVNPKEAITSILSWTQGALSLQDMINKLSQKQEKNKWLSQLISKLSDTTGNESTFQSQFFGVMCKSHQGYSVVMLENGKYAAIPVNNHPALSDIMETLAAKFRIKELPLFIHNGKEIINSDLLGSDKTTGKNNDFNLHQALTSLEIIRDSLNRGKELTGEMWEEAKDNILGVCKIIGYNVSEALLETVIDKGNTLSMTKSLGYIVNSLDKALEKQKENINNPKAAIYDPFKFKGENSIAGDIRNFLTPITNALDEIVPNVVYDDGKLYQAYVTPSYLTLLMEKFHWDDAKFNKFIQEEYGKSQWFKDKNGWRSDWIRRLATDPEARKIFAHTVELNFNKRRYMRNMSDADYTMSVLTHYWAEDAKKGESLVPAWFKMPMQSNKPSSEFIKFYSYRGSEYKTSIVEGIYDIFLQEISRIDTVRKRNCTKDDPNAIKNFDTNGRKFCFLPFLNNYLENSQADIAARTLLLNEDGTPSNNNSKLAKLIQKKATAERSLTTEEESELMTFTKEAIRNYMENRAKDILSKWEKDGIVEAAKNIKGIGTEKSIIMENLENFIWNDKFASMNILQLTIADLAAYKDAEDLQKRLAQLHAPGIRANIYATDFGNPEKGVPAQRVSDGKYRTVILQDFDDFVSNIIDNISEVFDRKIAEAPENEKAPLRALKESLVGEKGEFRKINVADAQGYSSPSSYRKKALMFGKWSKKAEDIYQKLKNGEYKFSELKEAFQPLKPFVYTQLHKDMGVSTAPIKNMPIPFQAKNSEYLLIMADALLKGESLSRPNLLRAVYRVMEDSELLNPTKGIDTIQFESAIKSGLQGRINIHQFMNVPGGEEAAYTFMMNKIYLRDAEGNMTKEYNTQTFVHETSYDSYCLQQEVPEHFKEHSQSHGSQERMIIPSDLPFYKDPNGDLSDPNNIIYYEWTDPDGTKRKVNAKEFRREYEETIANNIYLSIEALREELKLNSGSRKLQNIALSEILQREILDSPRYGIDMLQACSIDKETGEFKIPKGDPIQAKRIEQLINSIIKNRINKQEIAGGPIVQVSNFGTSKQLNIRFKARSGGLLMLKSEFKPTAKYKTYDEYKKAEQAGVAYYEVFIPIWANELFSKFADKDGNIDITTLELIDPELLEMVSYRIPTEDKYSIAPMRVAGFMPKEAGDAIMFPYELTSVDDSDFDVDKRYVMRKDISIEARFMPKANESMTDAEKEYIKQNKKTLVNQLIDSIKLRGKTTSEEREAIVKDAENKATMAKEAAKRAHLHKLDVIDNRNSQAEDAISNAKYSKDKEKDFEIYDKKADKLEKQYNKAVEKENQRYQIELDKIDADKDNTISKNITALENKKVRNKIEEFLTIDRFMSADSDDALTREIRKAYLNYMFHTVQDTTGKTANNNKIISMTLAVLTTEQVAPQLLNPGGFAAPKKMGYMVEAFKNSDKKWSDLEKLSTDELKKLSYKDKDLTWIDTQVQFYKQNAAAASLIGVFAVNKVAHATLESNGLRIAIDELCGEHPFTIAGTRFGNRMELDRRVDSLGNFIGKTLGSLVSASADAVKDPILNLMNINMTTAGMLNAMLRLGMPFNDAALFLSQNIITEVLKEFNRKNLSGYEPISNIIEKKLIDYRKEHNITEDSNINTEDLTKEELIEGLRNTEHDETDYKVLVAFQKIKKIADAIRKPTFATRFNSISSAVGPLIIDNLILEHKMEQFTLGNSKSTNFYDAKGNPVEITDIFDEHPILAAFSEAVDIAKRLFMDMPTGSIGFRQLLNRLPSSIADRIYNDKKLLNDLSNFYQSYMLIEAGLINPDQLKRYIENFPKWFVSQAFDKKYPDNVLIQNIRTTSSKKTDRTFLQINLIGEDETKKDEYRSAWIDLHKKNPELSQMLFNYFFFRAGIGFSPKTGMALVPSYVKERLKTNVANKEISYLDVYRNMPAMEHKLDIIIDQFIRNNWNESKLVPKMNIKDTSYKVDLNQGMLYVTEEKDLADLKGIVYMRTRINNKTYLWKLLGEESDSTNADKRVYRLITPLGDNAEYIEMNTKDIDKPMSDTTLDIEDNDATELEKKSPLETDAEESKESNLPKQEQVRNLTDFSQGIMSFWDTKGVQYNNEKINRQLESMKKSPERFGDLITASFERLGIKLDKENAIKEFKKLC